MRRRCVSNGATLLLLTFASLGHLAPASLASDAPPHFVLAWGQKGEAEGDLSSPIGVAVGPGDTLYVTEFHNSRVQKFDTEGKPLGSFPVAQYPGGIAVDNEGRVYVAPLLQGKICVYGPDGALLREWGAVGSGDGQFRDPGGIAVAPDGSIYVADQSNHRVQRFTPEGELLAQWGGHGSQPGQFGGKGTQNARFAGPHFLAFDRRGDLFTTEGAEGRIQKFTADGKFLLAWGENSEAPGGFGGREKETRNALPGPVGICVDRQDRVWVSATNNRVQVFTADGKFLHRVGADDQFKLPHAMAVDSQGNVYIADSSNHRIQKFAP